MIPILSFPSLYLHADTHRNAIAGEVLMKTTGQKLPFK